MSRAISEQFKNNSNWEIAYSKSIVKFIKYNIALTNRYYLQLKGKISEDVINHPHEIVYVPVRLIKYGVCFENQSYIHITKKLQLRVVGIIADGDWDSQNREKIYDYIRFKYNGFKERFIEGKDWEDTVFFKEYREWEDTIYFKNYKEGGNRDLIKENKESAWERYKQNHLMRWEDLYKSIKKDGYLEHNKTMSAHRPNDITRGQPESEIEVAVSRDGEILFLDGRNRLAIAKLLNIEEVPVVVNYWHKQYIENVINNTGNKKITPVDAIKSALEKGS